MEQRDLFISDSRPVDSNIRRGRSRRRNPSRSIETEDDVIIVQEKRVRMIS